MSYQYINVRQNRHLSEPDVRTFSKYPTCWSGQHYQANGDQVHFNKDNSYDVIDMYRAPGSGGSDVYACCQNAPCPLYCPIDCFNRSPGYVPNP